ncbi:hypothetical protein [Rhodovulum sulfidophilum]|uniref:hypothetical protein n=1 Tax=Rhodovulum sulfidophilum TaxID=35806 RepID=UPI001F2293FE|nr:hypothetical protein [Rhodovulum sulfidophilum]MCE8439625.1 hypothetical protein [Rhodovulum sulfidophilum]MCE8469997.1 hypothetical protein [Rhodovulum sulfidophilum]
MSRARDLGFDPFPRPLTGAEAGRGQSRSFPSFTAGSPEDGFAGALASKGALDPTAEGCIAIISLAGDLSDIGVRGCIAVKGRVVMKPSMACATCLTCIHNSQMHSQGPRTGRFAYGRGAILRAIPFFGLRVGRREVSRERGTRDESRMSVFPDQELPRTDTRHGVLFPLHAEEGKPVAATAPHSIPHVLIASLCK